MAHLTLFQFVQQRLLQIETKKREAYPLKQRCYFSKEEGSLFELFSEINCQSKFVWIDRAKAVHYFGFEIADYIDSNQLPLIDTDSRLMAKSPLIWGGRGFSSKHNKEQFFIPILQIASSDKSSGMLEVVLNQTNDVAQVVTLLQKVEKFLLDTRKEKSSSIKNSKPILYDDDIERTPTKERWDQQVAGVLRAINDKRVQKVVLARQLSFYADMGVPWDLFLQSVQKNRNCFHLFWQMNEGEYLVSATPERLFLRQGDQLSTEALAGTVKRTRSKKADQRAYQWLMGDTKNRHENQLVVKDILTQLTPYILNTAQSSGDSIDLLALSPEISKQRNIQHLKVPIDLHLNLAIENMSDRLLLEKLHPTAAIAGYPRESAQTFIQAEFDTKESFDRGWYSGYFGYSAPEASEYCVTIRSAYFQKEKRSGRLSEKLRCHFVAGAGIVAGSNAKEEWDEIDNKLETLLGLFERQGKIEL